MNTRLCDLVELETNDRNCVLLKMKEDIQPIDLIKRGFDGDETYLRLMKDPTNPSITVFHKEGKPVTMNFGSSTTLVSGPLRNVRDQIIETVTLDFGIFVTGYPRHGKSYDEMVAATLGNRDLNSRRLYELQLGSNYYSLFVNDQHVARINRDDYKRWMDERQINPIAQARYNGKEIGYLLPRDEALERPFTETFSHTRQDASSKLQVQIGEIDDGLVYPGYADIRPLFVDEAAFDAKEGVCYIPASGFEDITGDEEPGGYPLETCSYYTYQDFMALSNGSEEMAQTLFNQLDGRLPETILLEVKALSLDELIDMAKEKSAERHASPQQSPKDRKPPHQSPPREPEL